MVVLRCVGKCRQITPNDLKPVMLIMFFCEMLKLQWMQTMENCLLPGSVTNFLLTRQGRSQLELRRYLKAHWRWTKVNSCQFFLRLTACTKTFRPRTHYIHCNICEHGVILSFQNFLSIVSVLLHSHNHKSSFLQKSWSANRKETLVIRLSPGQTIATCQLRQHVAVLLGAACCVRLATLLRHVGCCWLKFDHFQTWGNNTRHIATRWPNARNMPRPTMLQSFGRGLTVPNERDRERLHVCNSIIIVLQHH